MRGYLRLEKKSWKYVYYVYLDYKDNQADSLFYREHITVKFLGDYGKDNSDWKYVIAKVRKQDEETFVKALRELPDKLSITGVPGYEEELQKMREMFGDKASLLDD